MSTEKEQEWKLYFLRNKIVMLYAGEEEENLPFLLRFCLNQTRGCARMDITSGKYPLRLILQVAHRVNICFTQEREKGKGLRVC